MSKLARQSVIKNISQIADQLKSIASTNSDEFKALQARLAKETDPFVTVALEERLKRLTSSERPSKYAVYKDDLQTLHGQLNAALVTMNRLPFYLDGLRTGEPEKPVKAPRKNAKKVRR